MRVILFVVTIIGVSEPVSTTPVQWVRYGPSIYRFGQEKLTFKEAEKYCQGYRGHLVHVIWDGENTFLQNFLRQHNLNGTYWLGMMDDTAKGVWYWLDDHRTVTVTDWIPGEPSDSNGEECAVFQSAADYKWANIHCEERHHALCEEICWDGIII